MQGFRAAAAKALEETKRKTQEAAAATSAAAAAAAEKTSAVAAKAGAATTQAAKAAGQATQDATTSGLAVFSPTKDDGSPSDAAARSPLVGGGGSPTASGEGGIGQAAAPQEAEEVVPIGAPRCSTCRKPLGHEWYTCSVCESDVCDQCPMHTDPRDEAESICQRCGPDAWDGKQV